MLFAVHRLASIVFVSVVVVLAITVRPASADAAASYSVSLIGSDTLVAHGGTNTPLASIQPGFTQVTLANPARVEVRDASGTWVATFTNGARTVTLLGPQRTFSESTAATVVTSVWVRLLPAAFDGMVDHAWLDQALVDSSPDLLAIAMQYIGGTAAVYDASGRKIAGDASYGPLKADGTRREGSDFNDYLGLRWSYGTTSDAPEADEIGSLDCSGFVRMVYGYRAGIAMSISSTGTTLPRRAVQMAASAPGIMTVSNTGVQVTDFSTLGVGDLVFFDASTDDGTAIDHVGIYLGKDTSGNPRFISSRKTADGPMFHDVGGSSKLNGTGFYAKSFRAARRL